MFDGFFRGAADAYPEIEGAAIAAMDGEDVAACAVADYCEEVGVRMASNRVYAIGNTVAIQSVTFLVIGKVVDVTHSEIVVDNPLIVYDTGRFGDFLARGTMEAAEPFMDPCTIGRSTIVFGTIWRHPVPRVPVPNTANTPPVDNMDNPGDDDQDGDSTYDG